MNILLKKIARLFKVGVVCILCLYIGLFFYFKYGWRNHYAEQNVSKLIADVQATRPLSDSFYIIYDKLYTNRMETVTSRYLKEFWLAPFSDKHSLGSNNWQLMAALSIPHQGYRYQLAPITLAFKINDETAPGKSFDYVMTKRYYAYSQKFKFKDTLSNLTNIDSIISFIVANERPHYYRVHPQRFKIERDSVKYLIQH